jgi:hypothetical protein
MSSYMLQEGASQLLVNDLGHLLLKLVVGRIQQFLGAGVLTGLKDAMAGQAYEEGRDRAAISPTGLWLVQSGLDVRLGLPQIAPGHAHTNQPGQGFHEQMCLAELAP